MELFLEISEREIINVFTEKFDNSFKRIEFKSIDDFYSKFESEQYFCSEEIEEKINELIDPTENNDSLSTFNIKHWVSNRSFGELIDMFENGEIIKPEMQREFVWDSLKCSRLIESIILGLPIPPLFLLEVDNNKYELIDGLQRLTTLYNFVKGYPWQGKSEIKKNVPSKLSKKVSKEIQGKTFEKLGPEHQRSLKRSTIPLIEFRQLEPNNISSKYLIFERINTGSEKLNHMQIRKSLAHGQYIKDLYTYANSFSVFTKSFSISNIKKDLHVEAFLRICLMFDYINQTYEITKDGMSNILNDYCETKRNEKIEPKFVDLFEKAMIKSIDIFGDNNKVFRRVEKNKDNELMYYGNLNVSIMESFIATLISNKDIDNIDVEKIQSNYNKIMYSTLEKALLKDDSNPFTTSTGSLSAIRKRLEICSKILEL